MKHENWTVRLILCFMICFFSMAVAVADINKERILIITSYNPDTERMNANLSEFYSEYRSLTGSTTNITIETMNCKNLSESPLWKARMKGILDRHMEEKPSLIILLGQEAWAAYLAQTSDLAHKTPAMAALVSTNTIDLPTDNSSLRTWLPESKEYQDFKEFNIVGGVFYKYNIERNIGLIQKFYPKVKNVSFLSDFTLGGVSLQALVRKCMKQHPDMKLELLDGRRYTLFNICNLLKYHDPNSVLLIGTWRIDSSENYVLANTSGILHDANPELPAFSVTSVGMGNWAIGGYAPEFSLVGKRLAGLAYEYLKAKQPSDDLFHICHNNYTFDMSQVEAFKLDGKKVPANAITINQAEDFYSKNKKTILGVLASMLFLALGLLLALYYIAHMRRLKMALEKQSKELIAARDKAEEANRLKTSFIANMSHEIRTPLNAIVGFSELQTMDDYSKEDKVEFGKIIKENTALLLNLINDILDISRIESGRVTIDSHPCDFVKLCHNCLVSVRQARPLEDVEYQEHFPVSSLDIKTDTMKLKQVIINLLTNASKFTKHGHIRLSFSVDEQAKTITVDVCDTGIGIPAEKAEAIFERFVKLNQYAQGTGLGLSLCKIIVERLGGRIWLDTDYKSGSRFVFTIPLTTLTPEEKANAEKDNL